MVSKSVMEMMENELDYMDRRILSLNVRGEKDDVDYWSARRDGFVQALRLLGYRARSSENGWRLEVRDV